MHVHKRRWALSGGLGTCCPLHRDLNPVTLVTLVCRAAAGRPALNRDLNPVTLVTVNSPAPAAVCLQDAKQLQKKTRKLMCCAIFIVLIVALVIVLAVVKPWTIGKS